VLSDVGCCQMYRCGVMGGPLVPGVGYWVLLVPRCGVPLVPGVG
jgi:hypothetical protein